MPNVHYSREKFDEAAPDPAIYAVDEKAFQDLDQSIGNSAKSYMKEVQDAYQSFDKDAAEYLKARKTDAKNRDPIIEKTFKVQAISLKNAITQMREGLDKNMDEDSPYLKSLKAEEMKQLQDWENAVDARTSELEGSDDTKRSDASSLFHILPQQGEGAEGGIATDWMPSQIPIGSQPKKSGDSICLNCM